MKWRRWVGIGACLVLMISCIMNWAFYPDIKKYFTGFYSEHNYYGRPGILLCFFGGTGVLFYLLKRTWSDRLNMIFSAIAVAYAITSFLRFTSGYDGFVPVKQPGIFLMLFSAIIHLLVSIMVSSMVKVVTPRQSEVAGEEKEG